MCAQITTCVKAVLGESDSILWLLCRQLATQVLACANAGPWFARKNSDHAAAERTVISYTCVYSRPACSLGVSRKIPLERHFTCWAFCATDCMQVTTSAKLSCRWLSFGCFIRLIDRDESGFGIFSNTMWKAFFSRFFLMIANTEIYLYNILKLWFKLNHQTLERLLKCIGHMQGLYISAISLKQRLPLSACWTNEKFWTKIRHWIVSYEIPNSQLSCFQGFIPTAEFFLQDPSLHAASAYKRNWFLGRLLQIFKVSNLLPTVCIFYTRSTATAPSHLTSPKTSFKFQHKCQSKNLSPDEFSTEFYQRRAPFPYVQRRDTKLNYRISNRKCPLSWHCQCTCFQKEQRSWADKIRIPTSSWLQ